MKYDDIVREEHDKRDNTNKTKATFAVFKINELDNEYTYKKSLDQIKEERKEKRKKINWNTYFD